MEEPAFLSAFDVAACQPVPPGTSNLSPQRTQECKGKISDSIGWLSKQAEGTDIDTVVAATAALDVYRSCAWNQRLKNFSNGDATFEDLQRVFGESSHAFRMIPSPTYLFVPQSSQTESPAKRGLTTTSLT